MKEYYKIKSEALVSIADAIRNKTGKMDSMTLAQMTTEIEGIETGGSSGDLTIAYGDTAPENKSALWVKTNKVVNTVKTTTNLYGTTVFHKDVALLPTARQFSDAAVAVGKKVYIFGGWDNENQGSNEILCFDTETLETTVVGHLPEKTNACAVARKGNYIYIFGGYGWTTVSCISKIYRFNTTDNTLEVAGGTIIARENYSAVTIGDKIYLVGGVDATFKSIEVYDTVTETVSILETKFDFPQKSRAIAWGKYILIHGGWSGFNFGYVYLFNPEDQTLKNLGWQFRPAQLGAFGSVGSVLCLAGGSGDGGSKSKYISTKNMFDGSAIVNNTAYSVGFEDSGIACVGNKLYVLGGIQQTVGTCCKEIHAVNVDVQLENSTLLIELTDNETYKLSNGMNIKNVYIGNENNEAEYVEAFLYRDGEWQHV